MQQLGHPTLGRDHSAEWDPAGESPTRDPPGDRRCHPGLGTCSLARTCSPTSLGTSPQAGPSSPTTIHTASFGQLQAAPKPVPPLHWVTAWWGDSLARQRQSPPQWRAGGHLRAEL